MKWVKRGLWVAAWGAWVWCGFGLELPTDPGPMVRKLPLEYHEQAIGFIGTGDSVLTQDFSRHNDGVLRFRVWNTRSGELQREFDFSARSWSEHLEKRRSFLSRGLIYWPKYDPTWRSGVLDLETGRWSSIGNNSYSFEDLHPTKPLFAFLSWNHDKKNKPTKLVVFDAKSSRTILEWPNTSDDEVVKACTFGAGGELFVLANRNSEKEPGSEVQRIYRLSIQGESLGEPVIVERPFAGMVAMRGDRIFGPVANSQSWDAIDIRTGKSVVPKPSPLWSKLKLSKAQVFVAPSGNRVFDGSSIWDIDTARVIWGSPTPEDESPPKLNPSSFDNRGNWIEMERDSVAVRDLENGRLRFRIRGRDVKDLDQISEDAGLVVKNDGSLFAFDTRVNFLDRALCQSILALPLILLWAALLWRRKRRVNLATVAETAR